MATAGTVTIRMDGDSGRLIAELNKANKSTKNALLDILKAIVKIAFLMLKNTQHMNGKRLKINALIAYTYQRILQA